MQYEDFGYMSVCAVKWFEAEILECQVHVQAESVSLQANDEMGGDVTVFVTSLCVAEGHERGGWKGWHECRVYGRELISSVQFSLLLLCKNRQVCY